MKIKSKTTHSSKNIFLLSVLSTMTLISTSVFAQPSDKPLSLQSMSQSVQEWDLLKADVKRLVAMQKDSINGNANTGVNNDVLLTSDVKSAAVVSTTKQLSLSQMSNSIKEWDELQPDVKRLITLQKEKKAAEIKALQEPVINLPVVEEVPVVEEAPVVEEVVVEDIAIEPEVIAPIIESTHVGKWGIQIGAYYSTKDIELATNIFYKKFGDLKETTFTYSESVPTKTAGKELLRLKVGQFENFKMANEQCALFKQQKFDCLPAKLAENSTRVNP